MTNSVSAAIANRDFSALLRKVRGGATFTVTSHGRPVARLVPIADGAPLASTARRTLFARLSAARPINVARWRRDDLYEDER
jgi:prevent-host-death family protein